MARQFIEASDLPEEPTPEDPDAWQAWLEDRLRETIDGYRAKPDLLMRDARSEKSITQDYADRELLEMVQNAADAAAEQGGKGRVRIEVRSDGLCVANTGMPFRAGGVRSLMTAHISDKPERKVPLIGAKGLGFRALLNWSREPFVTSGALEIGFSREHAAREVAALADQDHRIASVLARSRRPLVPILAFPMRGASLDAVDDPLRRPLIDRARALRAEGYETVVAAPFKDAKARKHALDQIGEFEPQFLLFVEALEEIVLDIGDGAPRRWSKHPGGPGQFTLEIAQGEKAAAQDWFCGRATGTLPDPEEPGETLAYALAVAVRQGAPTPPGLLHCFFPTEIPAPFPALLHATLEVDSSRKTLNASSEVNAAVLAALARFYAELTLTLRDEPDAPAPLTLLTRAAWFPEPLQTFEKQVYVAARALPVIPTNGGEFATAGETKVEPPAFAAHLPGRFFPRLARTRGEAERAVLSRLQVEALEQKDIVVALKAADMTLDERAAAIVGIARSLPPELHHRSLLLDTEGKPLTAHNTSFPPPATGSPPVLPWWAKAKFLHPELWQKISAGLGGAMRERYDKLQAFGLSEFSAAGVIASLRRQATGVIRRDPDRADTVKRELLQALLALRQTAVARDASFPAGATEVLCADGVWRDATATHLSAGYGGDGPILSALYAWDPGKLLAAPEALDLPADVQTLAAFFRWIGVQAWPRPTNEPLPVAYRPFVTAALPQTFDVAEGNFRREIERSELSWGVTCKAEHDSIAGLAGILAHAPSAAIVAWLALDPRFDTVKPTAFKTRLSAKSGYAGYKPYPGELPDIVRHMIATTPWLRVAGGEEVAPCDAMIAPGSLAALFKTPLRPAPEDEAQLGLTRAMWLRGLAHAQVPDRLSDLDEAQLYRLLDGLRKRDPAPDVVRRLYSQILQIEELDPARGGEAGLRFRTNGAVQVRTGGIIGWAPVREALYLDRDNFPAAARDHLALLDLPARRGAVEIEARLGVRPLSRQSYSLTVTRAVEDEGPFSGHLRIRFKDSLRFVKTLRLASSVDTSKLVRLDALDLVIVKEATLAFSLGDAVFDGQLDPGKHLLDGERLIVCIDPDEHSDEIMMRALTAMSDGLAEFFELQSGDDFEKLLLAPTNSLRMLQLRRLLGNQTTEEIEALLAAIETEIAPPDETYAVDAAILALATAPTPTPGPAPTPPTAPMPIATPAPTAPPLPSPAATTPPPPPPSPERATPPQATAVIVTVLEQGTGGTGSGGGGGWSGLRVGGLPGAPQHRGDVQAPNDAEEWATLYEESQGRFPLRVSRLQGEGAYGCDVLSFETEADRATFKLAPELHVAKIARFIEVKSGLVRLTRSEHRSALRNRARYFIYQVLFDAQRRASAHLNIVSDPLAYQQALVRECEVRIDKIPGVERSKLSAVAAG